MKPVSVRASYWHMELREMRWFASRNNDSMRNWRRFCKRQASKALRRFKVVE